MAKNPLFTATMPNGEVVTRRTARTYTHIVCVPSYSTEIRDAEGYIVWNAKGYPTYTHHDTIQSWHLAGWAGSAALGEKAGRSFINNWPGKRFGAPVLAPVTPAINGRG